MLFILTGEIQIGKTRWLQSLVESLSRDGVLCSGVLAPGDWAPKPDGGFEKRGINNTLLPQGETIAFARRRDLAEAEGSYDQNSASARAKLAWEISESALAYANVHFARLACREVEGESNRRIAREDGREGESRREVDQPPFGRFEGPELLVVDELGRLELCHGEGLTEALALVAAGTPDQWASEDGELRESASGSIIYPKHCLIVVRQWLIDKALEKFEDTWGEIKVIGPDSEGVIAVREALGVSAYEVE